MYTIADINGKQIEFENISAALGECKEAIRFLEEKERAKKQDHFTITYPEALANWKYKLLEIEKLILNKS